MVGDTGTGHRLVYRPTVSGVLFGCFVAFGVWWVLDEAIERHSAHAVVSALWLTAVSAALACLFWRPAVTVDDAAVSLRNLVRDVRIPWRALEQVDTRFALTLHAGGRRHQSWAGSAPGRPLPTGQWLTGRLGRAAGAIGPEPDRHGMPDPRWTTGGGSAAPASSRDLRADSGAAAFMVEQRWQSWRDTHPSAAGSAAAGSGLADVVDTVDMVDAVQVRWAPVLPAVAVVSGLFATLLSLIW